MMPSTLLTQETYELIKEREASLPENYKKILEEFTVLSIDRQYLLNKVLQYQPQITQLHRLLIHGKTFRPRTPIAVRIYRDGDFFFAENDNLVVCGIGISAQEALQDLCLHIHHFFEHYKKMDKSKLMGEGLRLKELYKELLVEEKHAGR